MREDLGKEIDYFQTKLSTALVRVLYGFSTAFIRLYRELRTMERGRGEVLVKYCRNFDFIIEELFFFV